MVSYSIPLLLSIECAMAGPIEQLRRNDAACQPLPTRGGGRHDHRAEKLNPNAAQGWGKLDRRSCLALTKSLVQKSPTEAKSDG